MDDKQDNTEDYELRLANALASIRASSAPGQDAEDIDGLKEALNAAHEANEGLRRELETLRAQRSRDVAELDTLISQLKPLIGEAS